METGKIPPGILQNLILPFTGEKRREVLVGPKFGEDCAVLDLGNHLVVLSTDPITGAATGLGRLAVHVSCNDVAATGACPVGLLFTILLPVGSGEAAVRELVQDIHTTAQSLSVAVLGGHTEITPTVAQTVIVATALGKVEKQYLVTASGARPGDEVILTKTAGLEGTAILAADLVDYLSPLLPADILAQGLALADGLSVVAEGITAARAGATAMHDVTEGGVKGALVELAAASGVGLEIWADRIPVAPATEAICRTLGIDPLGLVSSGALLIAAPPASRVMPALQEAGIPARVIGRVLPDRKLVLHEGGREVPLIAPLRDELYAALARVRGE